MRSLVEISLDTVDSTQAYAKRHTWSPDALVVISAEEQTAGRGQFERIWHSEKGKNLLVTFAFETSVSDLRPLAQLLSRSIATVLQNHGLPVTLKWPNDLLLSSKKCAGVLCEVSGSQVALGFGLNVNQTTFPLPATSLALETGHPWDRASLLRAITEQLYTDLNQFEE